MGQRIIELIDSDILTTDGIDVWVSVVSDGDDANIEVMLIDRNDFPATVIKAVTLTPDAAHDLGNKLRLAVSRLR